MDSGVVLVTRDRHDGGRNGEKKGVKDLPEERHIYSRKAQLNIIYFLSPSKKALNLSSTFPIGFTAIYWLLYSPVYPPQDYDATLAFIC